MNMEDPRKHMMIQESTWFRKVHDFHGSGKYMTSMNQEKYMTYINQKST